MTKIVKPDRWIVFVDTNVLLDFYRTSGEDAGKLLAPLEKHMDRLILTDQVLMEFLKNRQKVITETMKEFAAPASKSLPAMIRDFQSAKMFKSHIEKAGRYHKEITQKIERILADPTHNDPIYQSVLRIFKFNGELNLKRPSKDRYRIRHNARKRFILGYPPRKPQDTSIGDSVNWEWMIECCSRSIDNSNLLIVSRDSDYGSIRGGNIYLSDWLRREFKERVSKKRKIEITNRLTVAIKRLSETVTKELEDVESMIINENIKARDSMNAAIAAIISDFEKAPRAITDPALNPDIWDLIKDDFKDDGN